VNVSTDSSLTPPQRRALVVLFLLVSAAAALVAGGHTYAIDNEVQLQTTRALVQLEPSLESIDAGWAARDDGPYLVRPDGGTVAIVGIGYSIVSAPAYVAARSLAAVVQPYDRDSFIRVGTFFTNSWILGALAVAVALLAMELGGSFRASFFVGAAYALTTYALPHAKTSFTELSSALVLCLAVWALLRWRRTNVDALLAVCGAMVGFGVIIRASGILFVPFFVVAVAVAGLLHGGLRGGVRALLWLSAGGAPMLALFMFFNWWRFGGPLEIGYPRIPQSYPLLDGLEGLFLSPGKSLFLYAPIVIVGIVGMVVALRRQPFAIVLMSALCVINIFFFSRVPYWAGDAAWGPRYQHVIVPLLCAPCVVVLRWAAGRTAFAVTAGFGLVVSLLACTLYFNVLFLEADIAGVGANGMTYDLSWQPMLGMVEELPPAIRDVFEENRSGEVERGPFWGDPATHYAYYSTEPRLDVWWLWVRPTGASPLTYLYFLPIVAAILLAAWLGGIGPPVRFPIAWRTRSALTRSESAGTDAAISSAPERPLI
jgi:hypothetical protein